VKAQAREADVLVFLTKSYDTRATAHSIPLAGLVRPDGGVVLTLQNGMGNREVLQASLQPTQTGSGPGAVPVVLQGITDVGALLTQPGEVRHTGTGNTFLPQHRLMNHMRDRLAQAGLEVAVTEDIDKRAWMKLMVNAAINPLTALLRIPNGRLMSNPHLLDLAAEVVDEGVAVARASQVHLPSLFELTGEDAQAWDEVRRRVFGYVQKVATATAHNRSSMLRDVECGRRTEIDFINGYIAREGRRLAVATHLNAHLCALVKAISASSSPLEPNELGLLH
jgi:2-dehydropantoate 2-reductase